MSEAQASGATDLSLLSPERTHEARHGRLMDQTVRRNFRLGVGNGVLYNLGSYFAGKSTIVPTFLAQLTTSSALIGVVSQFESIGWYLPQLVVSTWVVHRAQKMPLYHVSLWVRVVAFFGIAAVVLAGPPPAILLILFVLGYGVFHFGAGIGGVVFLELVAKTVAPQRRGRFFGLRISIGSLLTATVGATIVTALLKSFNWPTNYGLTFLVGAVIATVGLVLMSVMREPRTPGVPEERSLREQLGQARMILRTDRRFRTYVETRLIMATWTVGVPFLVLFAQRHLGFESSDVGYFIAAECAGTVIGNFFWERLADRVSTKACLRGAAFVSIVLPIMVLLYTVLPLPKLLYPIVFSLSAAVDAGTSIGGLSHLIEISPEHDRATYIGLFNTSLAFPCLLTAAAGLLLDIAGYQVVYAIVLALGIASLFAVAKLTEIRHVRPARH
jgi:MFS family permease